MKKKKIFFIYLFDFFLDYFFSAFFGILNMMLPMQKINEYLFKIKDDEPLNISYEVAELDFDTVLLFFWIYL